MSKRKRSATTLYDSSLRYIVAMWMEEDACCEGGWSVISSSNSLFLARSTCRYRKQQHPKNKYVVIDRNTGKIKIWRYFLNEDSNYSYVGERINALEEVFKAF